MTRALIFAAIVSIFSACSGTSAYTADGGHTRQGCSNGTVVMPVKVVDVNSNPVSGATVTATNRATGKSVTGTTSSSGFTTAVTEALGAGDVDVTAKEGTRTSNVFGSYWTCGDCDCIVDPPSATLTVQ